MVKPPKKKPLPKDRFRHYKLAAIPVLLVVLAFVLFAPEGQGSQHSSQGEDGDAPVGTNIASQGLSHSKPDQPAGLRKADTWPEAELDFLGSPNPFFSQVEKPPQEHLVSAPPVPAQDSSLDDTDDETDTASDPVAESLVALTESLSRKPVNYIFESKRRKMVMLGEQLLEQGAPISESLHLHEIRDGALLVQARDLPATPLNSQENSSERNWQAGESGWNLPTWQNVRDFLKVRADQSKGR